MLLTSHRHVYIVCQVSWNDRQVHQLPGGLRLPMLQGHPAGTFDNLPFQRTQGVSFARVMICSFIFSNDFSHKSKFSIDSGPVTVRYTTLKWSEVYRMCIAMMLLKCNKLSSTITFTTMIEQYNNYYWSILCRNERNPWCLPGWIVVSWFNSKISSVSDVLGLVDSRTQLPIVEEQVTVIQIVKCDQELGIRIVGGIDTPLVRL